MRSMRTDPRYKKTLELRHAGQTLRLDVAQDLFSSQAVDVGTLQLLRSLDAPEHVGRLRVLDVGCGYGPLGLALKAQNPDRVVHLVDRDALAVDYAATNATQNAMSDGVSAYGSLGFDDVRAPETAPVDGFDLIVSNIPGKAGEPVIRRLLLDAHHHLAPDGLVAVVIVAPLADLVRSTLAAHNNVHIVFERSSNRYTVFHYRFEAGHTAGPQHAFDDGVYDRRTVDVDHKRFTWTLRTVHGLPEFDGPSYHTGLALDAVAEISPSRRRRVLVLNPGQGHLPCALAAATQLERIELAGRDLLALRTSAANLGRIGLRSESISLQHAAAITADGPTMDAAALLYPDSVPTSAVTADIEAVASRLGDGGTLILAGTSTLVSRTIDLVGPPKLPFRVGRRTKKKGHSAVTLRRR
jgi:16S rRNA G1207 methylase RsmC